MHLFDIVGLLLQPLNYELFLYFLKNDALVQNGLCLLFKICLLSLILMALVVPQFAVVSPYYKSLLVIVNRAASIAATNRGSGGRTPQGMISIFKE